MRRIMYHDPKLGKEFRPSEQYWEKIIDAYHLNRNEFGINFVGKNLDANSTTNDTTDYSSFPSFLFTPEQMNEIDKMVLTEEEQELLGLETIYSFCPSKRSAYIYSYESKGDLDNPILKHLPYEYVRKTGTFRVLNLHKALLGKLSSTRLFVIDYLSKHPNVLFDVHRLSDLSIKELCVYIDCYTELQKIAKFLLEIEDEGQKYLVSHTMNNGEWARIPSESSEYLNTGYCYPCREIKSKFPRYFFVEFEESSEKDYLAAKQRYKEELDFYHQHESMFDCAPTAPPYQGKAYIVMTEDGRKLLDWYKRILEISKNNT